VHASGPFATRWTSYALARENAKQGAILVHHACKLHVAGRFWETLDMGTGHRDRVPEVELRPKSE
jgi:hypothetical protein